MVVKIYVSGISGNKEVKKRQQRVLMILDSKSIKYDVIDITEPGREADKDFMQSNAKSNGATVSDPNPRSALPPQIFNDDEYCGDYDQFDMANEVDTLEQFLKVEVPPQDLPQEENKENVLNGDVAEKEESKSKENSQEREPASKEGTPAKEGTPLRDATPAKDSTASKEGSPAKEEEAKSKESSPEKDASPERQESVEKEGTPSEKAASPEKEVDHASTKPSKESSPEVNENGTVSSREQSAEKEAAAADADVVERKKDNPSEALIESEQAISTD